MQAKPSLAFPVKALVFDAYGTLFDVHSVAALLDEMFPGQGAQVISVDEAKIFKPSPRVSLLEKRDVYCCYSSPLARILQEQIRKQGLAGVPGSIPNARV